MKKKIIRSKNSHWKQNPICPKNIPKPKTIRLRNNILLNRLRSKTKWNDARDIIATVSGDSITPQNHLLWPKKNKKKTKYKSWLDECSFHQLSLFWWITSFSFIPHFHLLLIQHSIGMNKTNLTAAINQPMPTVFYIVKHNNSRPRMIQIITTWSKRKNIEWISN